jgi:TolA-binding protein
MKRILIYIIGFVIATAVASAQDYETDFRELQKQFEERLRTTSNNLRTYMEMYPHTPYSDEVLLMDGVLQAEKKKYKQAIRTFGKVKKGNLSRDTEPMLYFYWGYAYIQQQQYDKALAQLMKLKKKETLYSAHANYYAGYCYYCQQDYTRALKEFLSVEHLAGYQQIVPYYIIQIDYANHNYEQVYKRAEELLAEFPDNENNAELHRMLGELHYNDSAYNEAIHHLDVYRSQRLNQKKDLLRKDVYLLGMANYKTGKYDEAIQHLKEVQQLQDSISENTCLHLGHSYLRIGDEEKAKLSYAAAMRFKINDRVREEAMYNYVQITYLQGSALGEDITALQDFLREYPDTRYANNIYSLMADMYMASKNYKAALAALEGVKKPNAKMKETILYLHYQMGADAFLQGKVQEAMKWLNNVITQTSKTSEYKTEAYYLRAECHYRLQDYAACLQDLQRYEKQSNVKKSSNRMNAMYLKAYSLFNQQEMNQAEQSFRQYIDKVDKKHITYPDALNRLGDCQFYTRQFNNAISTYQKVASSGASANIDYALFQIGYTQGLLHRYPDKIQTLQQMATRYPRSDYADDAMYETARAQLQLEQHTDAVETYKQLLKKYPNSNKASRSSLELGMTYRTLKQYDKAIEAYKNTIQRYAGSEAAYAALEGLEQVYVETNRINDYLAYTKTLHRVNMNAATSEDSLVYVTAELQYVMGNYEQAAAGLTTYLTSFCPGGRYCVPAQYYAANSFYQLRKYDAAIEQYSVLADIEGNPYVEEACMRVAELNYDKEEYRTSLYYFERLHDAASSNSTTNTALLGIMRCNQHMGETAAVIDAATQLLAQETIADETRQEALYLRAKAYLSNQQYGLAVVDLTPLAKEVRTAIGAEAKYQLAYAYMQLGSIDMAEEEIMAFTQMQTTQQYWLAKSMILLADINMQRNDTFQAKQYLLALQANYHQNDDIQGIITQRLEDIERTTNQGTNSEEEQETPHNEEDVL